MKKSWLLPVFLILAAPPKGRSAPPTPTLPEAVKQEVTARVNQGYASLEKLYQHLHAHPELSFREEQTAERIAAELKDAGFEVTTKVGGHGIVGVLRHGTGPTLLVRTDLDALPVKEQTGLAYASTVTVKDEHGQEVNVMHACGHDIHMSVFIGTARVVASLKERWQGTLVFIGQPAEERGSGAKAMLADGLFSRFPKPDRCLALHVSPDIASGSVGLTEGFAMANVDSIDITIRGVGGHGAFPHKAKDPILLAAQTILALQTIVSRETEPLEPAVVTVGSIHGGTKHNIIPAEVQLQLTIRSFADDVRAQTIAAIKRIAQGVAITAGLPQDRMPIVTVADEHTPALYNHPEFTRQLQEIFQSVLGVDRIVKPKPVMGGEDFGMYGRTPERIPVCMFSLGSVPQARLENSKLEGKALPSLHSPFFAPDAERTIRTGVLAMSTAVLSYVSK